MQQTYCLLLEEGQSETTQWSLEGQEQWIIGSDPEACDVVIPLKEHGLQLAKIWLEGDDLMCEKLIDDAALWIDQEALDPALIWPMGTLLKGDTFALRLIEGGREDNPSLDAFDAAFDPRSPAHVGDGRWLVKVIAGPNVGGQVALSQGKPYVIGSGSECDIALSDFSVSKQHCQVIVEKEDTIVVRDLESRNGVYVNNTKIDQSLTIQSNGIISIGSTTLLVIDREAEQRTVFAPQTTVALPQQTTETEQPKTTDTVAPEKVQPPPRISPIVTGAGALFFVILFIALYGLGSLFQSEPILPEAHADQSHKISAILEDRPHIHFAYHEQTQKITLSGHVLTMTDKNMIRSQVEALPFIRMIDDTNLVIDAMAVKEYTTMLQQRWSGVTLDVTEPGVFVLEGNLTQRQELDELMQYLNAHFPYVDQTLQQVVVAEAITEELNEALRDIQQQGLVGEFQNGELIIVGAYPASKSGAFQAIVETFRQKRGVTKMRNLAIEQPDDAGAGLIDLTDRYRVTGTLKQENVNFGVVINNKILKRGDMLDDMTVVSIRPNRVILEKDGLKYRIDYNT